MYGIVASLIQYANMYQQQSRQKPSKLSYRHLFHGLTELFMMTYQTRAQCHDARHSV